MPDIRRSKRAVADLTEIWAYVARHNPSAADKLLDNIGRHWRILADHPHAGRTRDDIRPGWRTLIIRRYVILYKVERREVVILRVLHGHRNLADLKRSGLGEET